MQSGRPTRRGASPENGLPTVKNVSIWVNCLADKDSAIHLRQRAEQELAKLGLDHLGNPIPL